MGQWTASGNSAVVPEEIILYICKDSGAGVPLNTNGIVGVYTYFRTNFQYPSPMAYDIKITTLINDGYCFNSACGAARDLYLILQEILLIFSVRVNSAVGSL